MERESVPLKAWLGDRKINYGIKTGFNKAFFIDEKTRTRLIAEDPKSAELIKPLVVGKDIKRYEIEYKRRHLIWTYVGVPIDKYSAIFEHLKQFQPQLERRWDKGDHWWELRHCNYYADFEKPKIMYQDISEHGSFAYDSDGLFANNTVYFFNVFSRFLSGMLNSKLIEYWFRRVGAEYRGGYLRFFTQYMERLPIRRIAFVTPKEERARLVEEGKNLYRNALTKLRSEAEE